MCHAILLITSPLIVCFVCIHPDAAVNVYRFDYFFSLDADANLLLISLPCGRRLVKARRCPIAVSGLQIKWGGHTSNIVDVYRETCSRLFHLGDRKVNVTALKKPTVPKPV